MSEPRREARADGYLEDNPALFDMLEEQAELEHAPAAASTHARSSPRC
jgi:hypothetical protein